MKFHDCTVPRVIVPHGLRIATVFGSATIPEERSGTGIGGMPVASVPNAWLPVFCWNVAAIVSG